MPENTRHGLAWSADEERSLYDAFVAGTPVKDIAGVHGRTTGGIRAGLKRLGLIDDQNLTVTPPPVFTATPQSAKRLAKKTAKTEQRAKVERRERKPRGNTEPDMNERFCEAMRLMQDTGHNVFITGKAGTGKSTLLSYFCRTTNKEPVVLAPTGIAALNVKGQTIHRFFNFYVDVTPEKIRQKKFKPRNARLYKKLRMIIIDEVSMLRADLLDCIETFLTLYGPHVGRPFGGVQMVFVGDLYQLPPVVTAQEKDYFTSFYPTPYFFSARALSGSEIAVVELDTIYRQKDQDFIDLLNRIRTATATAADLRHINSRYGPAATKPDKAFSITLTTTNAVADAINETHLAALKGKAWSNNAEIEGEFGREYFPTATELQYKLGAQIMLLNNDPERRWVNGSLGVIEDLKKDESGNPYLVVRLQDSDETVAVTQHTWDVHRFNIEDDEIVSEPVGAFRQFPFRLAWAVTIHKSQGKTFKRVVIDTGRGAFAAGQIYVALSRCTSFEGITLKTPVRPQDIHTDPRILAFLGVIPALAEPPPIDTLALIRQAIAENATLDILYRKADDSETTRRVRPRLVGTASYQGDSYDGMKAFCLTDQQELTFRLDRILRIAKLAG